MALKSCPLLQYPLSTSPTLPCYLRTRVRARHCFKLPCSSLAVLRVRHKKPLDRGYGSVPNGRVWIKPVRVRFYWCAQRLLTSRARPHVNYTPHNSPIPEARPSWVALVMTRTALEKIHEIPVGRMQTQSRACPCSELRGAMRGTREVGKDRDVGVGNKGNRDPLEKGWVGGSKGGNGFRHDPQKEVQVHCSRSAEVRGNVQPQNRVNCAVNADIQKENPSLLDTAELGSHTSRRCGSPCPRQCLKGRTVSAHFQRFEQTRVSRV